jgi:hypothetical protein
MDERTDEQNELTDEQAMAAFERALPGYRWRKAQTVMAACSRAGLTELQYLKALGRYRVIVTQDGAGVRRLYARRPPD